MPGATSPPSIRAGRRCVNRCSSAVTTVPSRRRLRATAGSRRPPTGRRSWSGTTSTSSTSAHRATCTPTSPSPRSRPASTSSSRSRWPTPSRSPRRWCVRRRPQPVVASGRWSASTTAASRPSRWRGRSSLAARSATSVRCVPAICQDWLADEAAPMTWRLRRETAGSGALGDLGSHVVDQIQFLLDQPVTRASGHLHTFVDTRSGDDGPEPVTVDDAAWATLETSSGVVASVEVTSHGHRSQERADHRGVRLTRIGGVRPRAAQRAPGVRRRGRPRRARGACSSPRRTIRTSRRGGRRDTSSAGTTPSRPRPRTSSRRSRPTSDPSPSFADGLRVQRVLAAIEDSAAGSGAAVDVVQED